MKWSMSDHRGFKCGHVQSGVRHDGVLIRLTGAFAESHWRDVMPFADNVTRFDIQRTLRLNVDVDEMIKDMDAAARRRADLLEKNWEVRIINSRRCGPTLYLGSRKSSSFFRGYNKYRESKLSEYENCIRLEEQFQGGAADDFASGHYGCSRPEARVAGWLAGRLTRNGCGRLDALEEDTRVPRRAPRTDNDRRLRWLAGYVRGSVQRLVEDGRELETCIALGFEEELSSKIAELIQTYRRSKNDAH